MSHKVQGSSVSADSTQVRYQKALKEINKLIGVNTQLRDEVNKDQQAMNELQYKLQAKNQQLMKALKQINYLQIQLTSLTNEKSNIVMQNEELKKQLSRVKVQKNPSRPTIQKVQSRETYLNDDKLNGDQQFVIYELQRLLNDRDVEIKQLKKRIPSIQSNLEDADSNKMIYSENVRPDFIVQQLNRKLAAAYKEIERLNLESNEYKSKFTRAQTSQLLSSKSTSNLPVYSPSISPRTSLINISSTNSAEVLKRYHKLEQQNKKTTKKYEHSKHEVDALKESNEKLQKENNKMQRQITGYEQLIIKQQNIINDLHVNFDEEVLKMTNEFKQKLQEQRESFSPNKVSDHMKTIQNLQTQNKSLKKKFQLCSIELTKCFKTLEIYKTKLSQCQKDYSDLVTERQQLLQRLNRLQNTHRDRSTHSRGSRIIMDNDRRNSMGETGYFNHN